MKCFEKLIKQYMVSKLPSSFDPFQFAYRPNHSTEDAISSVVHLSLQHLEEKNTHMRMLFFDFSSAFKMIIPQQSGEQTGTPGLHTLSTGAPQAVSAALHVDETRDWPGPLLAMTTNTRMTQQ